MNLPTSKLPQIKLAVLFIFALLNDPVIANPIRTSASPDELQQMFNQGLYSQMLAKLNATLAGNSSDSGKPVRYTLLMLKGEALLRTKASDSALDAFRAASLVGDNDKEIAVAQATAALIKHSSAGKYSPKTKVPSGTSKTAAPPVAIDIVDPISRKLAFAALFTDLVEAAKPQVDRAEKMTTLPPILEAATTLSDLRPVEIASTDADTQSKDLLQKLGDHASTLMTDTLKSLDTQITALGKQAATRQKRGKTKANNVAQALLPDDVSILDNIVSSATQIGKAAVSMEVTFGDPQTFKSVESDAKKTIDQADKLLKQYNHPAANQ